MSSETSKRPSRYAEAIKREAARAILPEIKNWLRNNTADDDELVADLVRCADSDSYAFAKRLDDQGWYPDAELVEILEGFDTYGAHNRAVLAWVAAEKITVPFAVGDLVTLRGQTAKVVAIRANTAEIVAQPVIPDGHSYGDTGGWVHAAEDATPAEVTS
jgi:hypothetical protein